jgi:hypothetical protein
VNPVGANFAPRRQLRAKIRLKNGPQKKKNVLGEPLWLSSVVKKLENK